MADAPRTRPRLPGAPQEPERSPWRVEGAPSGDDAPDRPRFRPPGGRWFWWLVVGALVLNVYVSSVAGRHERPSVPYTTFRAQVQADNVSEVSSQSDQLQGNFRRPVDLPRAKGSKEFRTVLPAFVDNAELSRLLNSKHVVINARPLDQGRPFWETLLFGFGPTLLLVGLFVLLMRRAAGAAGGISGLGRSRAKRYEASDQRTTFEDVAGIDEAEEELVEIVDFLRNPDRYRRLGGMIPKGVLLSGPPGTGKTLLARAVAGEANVPFFSMSASEFIEMVVGVGASRVRDLFEQAKKAAPAIIFVDELDAIGRQRGGAASFGGHDEREQTLNQILTEMDGFTGTEGVIVLAATNRPEILDPALLRPGRFDRRVTVNPPDQVGRKLILEVHTRSVPLGDDVDLESIASSTPGMVGADLRNLVNEAALTAARRNHERVQLADFTDALEKILLGAERRITLSVEERERTAYHESGHALLGMLEPGADPVRKVSIVPRGRALGVTFQSPSADRYGYGADYLRGRIVGALGGRAAEELIYGDTTTGAESDLEQVTAIARQMVGRWGMSEAIGPVSVIPGPQDEALLFPGQGGSASEATRQLVDSEVRRVIEECYDVARQRLADNRDRLEALARALLERETLDERDAYAVAGFPPPPTTDERSGRMLAPQGEREPDPEPAGGVRARGTSP
jgi:cell division protease FtsH